MKTFDTSIDIYATRVKNIITSERNKSNRVITISKIRNIYNYNYKNSIGSSILSRVMKRHLGFKSISF